MFTRSPSMDNIYNNRMNIFKLEIILLKLDEAKEWIYLVQKLMALYDALTTFLKSFHLQHLL